MRCNVSYVLFLQKKNCFTFICFEERVREVQIEGYFAELTWTLKNVNVMKDKRGWGLLQIKGD